MFLNIPILFFLHCFANFVTGAVTAAPDRTGINSQLSSRSRNGKTVNVQGYHNLALFQFQFGQIFSNSFPHQLGFYTGPLFTYENKQLRLTDIGRIVYQSMKQMENREIYLQKQIHYLQNKKRDIKFGATMTIGEFLLSNIIDDYLRKYPDSSLHMQVHNTQTLLEKLDNAELDFAFIEGNFSKNKYKSYPFRNSRFIPVCGPECALKNRDTTLSDMLKERLIIRELGSGTRDIFESILHTKNHETSEFLGIVEVENMNAIKDLLLRSVGISFLYEDVVEKELREKELFEINLLGWNVSHKMSFVWRRENEHMEVIQEFLSVLEEKSAGVR